MRLHEHDVAFTERIDRRDVIRTPRQTRPTSVRTVPVSSRTAELLHQEVADAK